MGVKIKIPYSYRIYAFSEEGTKYSKKLAEFKLNRFNFKFFTGMFTFVGLVCLASWITGGGNQFPVWLLFVAGVISFFAAHFCAKKREETLKAKLRSVLERDLKPYEQSRPELVKNIREHIKNDLS